MYCILCNFYNDLLSMADGGLKLSRRMQYVRVRWFVFISDQNYGFQRSV